MTTHAHVTTHVHFCRTCGHRWECIRPQKGKIPRCEVDVTAGVNGEGPICDLCRYLEMARRHASVRGLRIDAIPADARAVH